MVEVNNKTRSRIDISLVKKITEKFLAYNKLKNKDVSIAFVGDTTIGRLNKIYRGQNKITDVLAFQDNEKAFLGEIVIDYAQIKRQAYKYSKTAKAELVFILVHGLLHLIGHDDKTDKAAREMERLGKEFINHSISNFGGKIV